jgi:hypothetical protein
MGDSGDRPSLLTLVMGDSGDRPSLLTLGMGDAGDRPTLLTLVMGDAGDRLSLCLWPHHSPMERPLEAAGLGIALSWQRWHFAPAFPWVRMVPVVFKHCPSRYS